MQIRDRIKELRRVPASELIPNPKNWRTHPVTQQDALRGVLAEVGYADALIARETPEGLMLVDGHLRAETTPDSDVPVLVLDIDEAEADLILATLDPLAAMADRDSEALNDLISTLEVNNEAVFDMLEQMGHDITIGTLEDAKNSLNAVKKNKMIDRTLPIDMIISLSGSSAPYCCIAVVAGLSHGKMSGSSIQPCNTMFGGRHKLIFVDNDFHDYNHQVHLDFVKEHRPKYATARDVMTKEQCREAGVDYYSLEQILEMGEELNEYAENVIVIPKYDCIDDIPAKYMLGYSIPTSYGGTPLPLGAFEGRNVHLLGGSWQQQRNALELLGDDVKSADNNQVLLLARYGTWNNADGSTTASTNRFGEVSNIAIIAFTISCGAIAAGVKELLGEAATQSQEEIQGDIEPFDPVRS